MTTEHRQEWRQGKLMRMLLQRPQLRDLIPEALDYAGFCHLMGELTGERVPQNAAPQTAAAFWLFKLPETPPPETVAPGDLRSQLEKLQCAVFDVTTAVKGLEASHSPEAVRAIQPICTALARAHGFLVAAKSAAAGPRRRRSA